MIQLRDKGSDYNYFSYLPCSKYKFLPEVANQQNYFIKLCYTISVSPIIPESENLKIAMKKIDEKEKTFAKKSISTLRPLFSAKIETLSGSRDASSKRIKTDFGKKVLKASLSQNFQ